MKRRPQHEWIIPADCGEDGIPAYEYFEQGRSPLSGGIGSAWVAPLRTAQYSLSPSNPPTDDQPRTKSVSDISAKVSDFRGSGWGSERRQGSENPYYEPPVVVKPNQTRRDATASTSPEEDRRREIETRRRWLYANCEAPQPKNLRLLHGYSPRQLAKLLDEPGFIPVKEKRDLLSDDICIVNGKKLRKTVRQINRDICSGKRKRFPKTISDLESCAPIILVPELSLDAAVFYKDLASGNFKTEMIHERIKEGRYGKQRDKEFFNPVEIADWIIKRAWSLNLLKPNQNHSSNPGSTIPDQGPVEVDHGLEIKAMGKGIGTIGQVVKAKHGRPLYSFEGGRQHGPGHVRSGSHVGKGPDFGPVSTEGVAEPGGSERVKDGGNNRFDRRGIEEFYEGGDEFSGLTDDYSERSGDDIKRLD
jgi:hypothetical protein